jgi:hypothetical protein
MLIDRKARGWIVVSVIILAAATASYLIYANWVRADPRPDQPMRRLSGGSLPGLIYGLIGTLMILFAWLLWFKKTFRNRQMGNARWWMQGHVWLGLLAYPIIWYHACLRFGGPLTTALMIVFTVVFLTGIIGLYFQAKVPARIMREIPSETIAEQIDHVVGQLRKEASLIVERVMTRRKFIDKEEGGVAVATEAAESERKFQDFYNNEVLPVLAKKVPRSATLAHGSASSHAFRSLRDSISPDLRDSVSDLESIVDERRQFELQRHLQRLLHAWLLFHVPLSYAMIVLMVIHVIYAMQYATLPF